MRRTILKTGLLAPMVLFTAYPDTVTTTGNLSINGSVTQMSGGTIVLQATFSSGKTTLTIPMSAVQSIGFNATTFNPGPPPKLPITGPPGAVPNWADASIVLRGGQRKVCNLLNIDPKTVHCGGKGADYPRGNTLRVLAGAQ